MYKDKWGKTWWKGNLHLHSTLSDGEKPPEEAMRLYKEQGYDFISLTDHWHYGEGCVYDGMLVIPGCEYNIGEVANDGIYHMVCTFADYEPACDPSMGPQELIDLIHKAGGIADLGHPAWSLMSPQQIMDLRDVDVTEIYNSVSDFPFNCHPDSGYVLDLCALKGHRLPLIAVDDAHFFTEKEVCRSYTMVQADECTPAALKEAILAGRMYGSQGPEIYVELRDGKVYVETSPVERITYFTDNAWLDHRSDVGHGITSGCHTPEPGDHYVRVEAVDAEGRTAWSQYYDLDM